MTDHRHLAHEMKLGKFPDWSPRLTMRLGEELEETLDQHELLMDSDINELVEDRRRLREILVAYGALSPNDDITGPLDLLEVLLPAREP